MRRIRTTPRCWIGAPLLFAAWALAGCVAPSSGGTTDVALDTGEATTGAPDAPETSDTSTGAASTLAEEDTTAGGEATGSDTGSDTGDAATTTTSGDPSTGEPDLCGNGAIDPGEECDGANVEVDSCAEVDEIYSGGAPICDAACKLDTSPCQTCEAPEIVPCDQDSQEWFHALELGCDAIEGFDPANAVKLDAEKTALLSKDTDAFRVTTRFGSDPTAWTARAGKKALLLSTGGFAPPTPDGATIMPPGSATSGAKNQNGNPDGGYPDGLRIKMVDGGASPFSGCDGENDCSNTLTDQWNQGNPKSVFDVLSLELTLTVPAGTHGFALDLAYFSAHFPEHKDDPFNDVTVLWATSERYVGNIAYLDAGDGSYRPLSLPALYKAGWMTHDGKDDPALAGTGYDGVAGQQGGSTDWLTVHGPAVPGESLVLAVTLFDFHDMFQDTAILLDNFRWSCAGCEPGVDCGVTLAQ